MITTVLVPMAGNGSRFATAGYAAPKPLIDVLGRPMVFRAVQPILEALEGTDYKLVFVVRDAHKDGSHISVTLWNLWPGCRIVSAPPEGTQGAACTCLLARHYFDNDQPLLIANCDQIVHADSVKALVSTGADGAILTMPGDGSKKWSYAKVDKGEVIRVKEKEPISDRATCGLYWWKEGGAFASYTEKMMFRNDRVNNEFYVAPVMDYLIRDDLTVREVRIEDHGNVFHGLGTPEDLEKYLNSVTVT